MRQYSKREPKEYNWFRKFFQWFVLSFGYANIYRISCGYKVLGKENIPKKEFFIAASNHVSALDPFLMCDAMKPRFVAYMAKKELFEKFWSAIYMDFLGAFAVDREKLQVSTMKTALGLKKTDWILGMFPQGTRGEAHSNLEHINAGFAVLAKSAKCSVLPVGIVGIERAERHDKETRMVFNIGKPIPYNENPDEMIKIWKEKIFELTDEENIAKVLEKPKKNYARRYIKDTNIWTRLYQHYAVWAIFKPATFLFYKFTTTGKKNIQKGKNYIFAPNHISYLDPFVCTFATGKRQCFMAKKELFEGSDYIRKNIWRLGAFSINREKPEASSIKSAIDTIKNKWNLCIFPQGGIRKNKKIEEINKGFVAIAKKTKADILPMSITGLEHYNWNPFNRAHVKINIGEAISYLEDDDVIVQKWREQVAKMSGYELGEG